VFNVVDRRSANEPALSEALQKTRERISFGLCASALELRSLLCLGKNTPAWSQGPIAKCFQSERLARYMEKDPLHERETQTTAWRRQKVTTEEGLIKYFEQLPGEKEQCLELLLLDAGKIADAHASRDPEDQNRKLAELSEVYDQEELMAKAALQVGLPSKSFIAISLSFWRKARPDI